jgi:hypothetical protein
VSSVGRLRARPRERTDGYAFCAEDRFWFRPSYTDGKCPICGTLAPGGAPRLRRERSWLGMAALAVQSLAMLTLVLFMYFKG